MTPEERQMLADLFQRVSSTGSAPRDPQAEAFINDAIRALPYAPYVLAQTVLVQQHALEAATPAHFRAGGAGAQRRGPACSGNQLPRQPRPQPLRRRLGAAPPPATAAPGQSLRRQRLSALGGPSARAVLCSPAAGLCAAATAFLRATAGALGAAAPSSGGGFLSGALHTAAGVAGGMVLANAVEGLFGGRGGGLFGGNSTGLGNDLAMGGFEGPREVVNNYYEAAPGVGQSAQDIDRFADSSQDDGEQDQDVSDDGGWDDGSSGDDSYDT